MVSATPNSITVGWVPPKFENGELGADIAGSTVDETIGAPIHLPTHYIDLTLLYTPLLPTKGAPINRYEIQRLVLDQNHPDWDKGRESITTGGGGSATTTTATTGNENSNENSNSNSNGDGGETDSTTTVTVYNSSSSEKTSRGSTNAAKDTDTADADGVNLPSVLGGGAGLGSGSVGEERKQVGVWVGQRTDKMLPYHTAAGLPTYCRYSCLSEAINILVWNSMRYRAGIFLGIYVPIRVEVHGGWVGVELFDPWCPFEELRQPLPLKRALPSPRPPLVSSAFEPVPTLWGTPNRRR